jgi:protein gp37
MNSTRIETADLTWNPVTGCDNICFDGDCYAYQLVQRFGKKWGYDWKPRLHKERLGEPFKVLKPKLIFAPSMGDLMTPSLKDSEVLAVTNTMNMCDWHRFQVQTKYSKRLPKFRWPSNVWLGVSLCKKGDEVRLDDLRETDARIKYAYCEPLLQDLDPDFTDIDWVVIGAKTGSNPFQPEHKWVFDLSVKAFDSECNVFHKNNLLTTKSPLKQFPDQKWFDTQLQNIQEGSRPRGPNRRH